MKEGKEGNVWFNLSVYTEEERGISEGLHPSNTVECLSWFRAKF